MLMSAHNRAVDLGIFVIGIPGQDIENPLPYAPLGPAAKARMHALPLPKSLWQIAPGNANAVPVQHRFHKQPVILGRHPHCFYTSWQQILDALPLVIS
jgi:hypothetical protein